ncbi:MAG: LamG domain-containing protein, partial [Solirubrobacteraceae bacterium]
MLNRLPLAALVLVIAALTAAPALGATGPVGIWTLDEGSGTTVTDGSGNGNNGVLSGGTTWVPGISGSAVGFDGFSGQIKVEDNDALEPAGAITVSAWVKHAGSPGTYRYIVAKGGNGCIAASYGLYSGPSGGLQFYVSQHHGSVYARSPDAGQGIWDANWHLAVGTYDGTTIRLYVDGVEVGSGTAWTGALEYLLPSSNDFYIGNYPSCQDHWFAGAIDDVMVWGRALSASEISAMVPGSSNPTGPNPPSTPGAGGGQNGGGAQGGSGGTGSG